MDRRNFLKFSSLAALGLSGCTSSGDISGGGLGGRRPNILMLCVDDLRPQLGCYGHDYMKTPNIDALAAQGMLFKRAYCNVPVCGPSRISVMTGMRTNRDVWKTSAFKKEFTTLPMHLKNNGYHAVSNGKIFHFFNDRKKDWSEDPWRAGENPIRYLKDPKWAVYNNAGLWQSAEAADMINPANGFGPFYDCADVPDDAYHDGKIANKTIEDLKRLGKSDKPFFIATGFWRPHLPFNAPKKYWDMYDADKIELADNRYKPKNLPERCKSSPEVDEYAAIDGHPDKDAFHRKARHGYYACVSYVDAQVGKIMKALDDLGLRDNTIVVLWGDHGYNLGEHNYWSKHNTLHNSLHSPLIISAPGFKSGITNSLVEFIDIYPTLTDLGGVKTPATVEGQSLKPLLKNPGKKLKDAVFINWLEKNIDPKEKGKALARVVKTDRYLYTQWRIKDEVVDHMLFDHAKDPNENVNVADDPKYNKVVKKMKKLLERQYE